MRIRSLFTTLGLLVSLSCGLPAAAADSAKWPERPIRLIVPSAPGGAMDIFARAIAQSLSGELKQSVIVDNRGGAGGLIAAAEAAKSAPDGYTVFLNPHGIFATAKHLHSSLTFDPVGDFAPVSNGVSVTNVLVVNPALPVNSVQELIQLAKNKPHTLNYSSSGPGGSGHLAGELFAAQAGVDVIHVPYKGGGPAVMDLVAGHVQYSFATAPSVLPLIKDGKLRPLAVTTSERLPALPDTPALREAGLPEFEASNWYSFQVPANTPRPVIDKLNAAIHAAFKDPALSQLLSNEGLTPAPGTPEELAEFIATESERWEKIIRARNITVN